MQKLIQNSQATTNKRVRDLKNSFKAYSQKDESDQIKRIMRDHQNTIQYLTKIEDIRNTSNHSALSLSYGPKYSTIPDMKS